MDATMIQELVTKATDKELRNLLATPFAPFAQTEIEFRITNADAIKAETVAKATELVSSVFPNASDNDLVVIARLMKPQAPKAGITKDLVPAGYTAIRDAVLVVLQEKDINPWESLKATADAQ